MCLNPKCRYITITEDDEKKEKTYTHYEILEDGTFKEIFNEVMKIEPEVSNHLKGGIYIDLTYPSLKIGEEINHELEIINLE